MGRKGAETMKAEVIYTDKANQPTGPFVQAIKVGNLLFLSGFRGIDPKTNQVPKGDFRAEAKLVLENIKALVEAAGGTMANVVATTVYVRDMFRFRPVVNELYEEYFGKNLPTRTIVEISRLNGDDNVEITATAWIP
jgi:2-iminobutanoate/2-iminopropanoate deaminase